MGNEGGPAGFKPAVVTNLAGLADYMPDSIISRMLVKNEAGNITFFAFAKGQGLSRHSAPFNAFVQVLEGEGVITIDEKDYTVKAGEAVLMPADVPHAVTARQDFKMLLVMLKG
jgi:quercetin dioxygenase-like cupin family protein